MKFKKKKLHKKLLRRVAEQFGAGKKINDRIRKTIRITITPEYYFS